MKGRLIKVVLAASLGAVLSLGINCYYNCDSNAGEEVKQVYAEKGLGVWDKNLKPIPISEYNAEQPASLKPFLLWHNVTGAVYYEVELLTAPPEQENTLELSKKYSLFSTRSVFVNGYQADLTAYAREKAIYWRARAFDFWGNPIGVFSTAQKIVVDSSLKAMDKPVPNTFDNPANFRQPLYPAYSWVPLNDDNVLYEVELLNQPPEIENNTEPSQYRIWSSEPSEMASSYDTDARMTAGDYWWRVRAIDEAGNTVGVYSDAQQFTVPAYDEPVFAAAFGDSITHGGGALSYSPNQLDYSYETYLDFPALNLGRSGDTAAMSAERFEADVLPFRPQNLLILCGTNDLRAAETSGYDIVRSLDTIRRKCEKNHIRPIFLTLMPINPDNIYAAFQTETDEDWADKLAIVNKYIRQQKYYIDLEPEFYDDNGNLATKYSTDGLHGDIAGKKLMAKIINEHKQLLKSK